MAGASDAIAKRAAAYVSDKTWRRLSRRWNARYCRALARIARRVLDFKKELHDMMGDLAEMALDGLHPPRIVRRLVRELVKNLPLPIDEKLIALARGLQVVGIHLCLVGGRDISRCACAQDMLEAEGKQKLTNLLRAAAEDWRQLPQTVKGDVETIA